MMNESAHKFKIQPYKSQCMRSQMSQSPSKKSKTANKTLTSSSTANVLFSQSFQPQGYKLIEAPDEVAISVLAGNQVYLKGTEVSADAVLCTAGKTYSLKKVETSNSVFLVPSTTTDHFEIISKAAEYYEVINFVTADIFLRYAHYSFYLTF